MEWCLRGFVNKQFWGHALKNSLDVPKDFYSSASESNYR